MLLIYIFRFFHIHVDYFYRKGSDMQSFKDIWNTVLEKMKEEFSEVTIDLWFGDLEPVSLTPDVAVFENSSEFKKEIIEKRYTEVIKKYLSEIIGFEVPIEINLKSDISEEKPLFSSSEVSEKSYDYTNEEEDEPTFYSSNDVHPSSGVQYSSLYTFENFIEGSSNTFAYAACLAVADPPAKNYNPLFIYGPSGLGKTHLLYAIMNRILERHPGYNIVYVKGEEFTNQLINSISKKTTAAFREKYRKTDVLLIDDIQFIAGKASTQEEFFHTFNALYEDGKQIILTSDRPPRDINPLEDRLKTRFEWGVIADIAPPDFELRIAIMQKKAESLGITVPNDVLNYLADMLKSNIRQIEGAIKKLGANSLLYGLPITMDLAVKSISDLLTGTEPVNITVDKIFEKVSKKYGISIDDLKGRKKTKEIALARHKCIYVIRNTTQLSTNDIGRLLSRDHSTVLSSINFIDEKKQNDTLLEIELAELIKEVKGC